MNISVSCARSIKDFRLKNNLFILSSLVGLGLCGKMFVLDQNSFYQLIYLSELIIGFFMMLVVLFNQQLDLESAEYVFTMSYLIKESERGNVQYTDQELEEMIKARSMGDASSWSLFYTSVKMDFHHFCCESKDFLYLVLSAGIITSYFFESRFQSNQIAWLVFLLFIVTACDFVFVVLGLIIELPRRIRQEYKLRALHRRASRQLILGMQNQSLFDNQEGQGSLLFNILDNEFQEEEQVYQPQQIQEAPQHRYSIFGREEQLSCQICFDPMVENSDLQQLQCHSSHLFHSNCIQDWFQRNRQNNLIPSCPICRAPQNR
ncbi:unnamed protein product [Paramecium octaurelia]|uniref:RING-type domain-containing protein n=1 Tax=Paramecium octaurelia TaxID=43137 RepID=A0A8S1WM99_PAROT|nr:unnamed protein product [Paramecium octaurelia]